MFEGREEEEERRRGKDGILSMYLSNWFGFLLLSI